MIHHLAERIEYAKDELAWLERGAPEGEEPWRGWDFRYRHISPPTYCACGNKPTWDGHLIYRRRPKLIHAIDAKGVRWGWPEPMREAPAIGTEYWIIDLANSSIGRDEWDNTGFENDTLRAGLCQATEEGAQQQLSAMRAIARGGE